MHLADALVHEHETGEGVDQKLESWMDTLESAGFFKVETVVYLVPVLKRSN